MCPDQPLALTAYPDLCSTIVTYLTQRKVLVVWVVMNILLVGGLNPLRSSYFIFVANKIWLPITQLFEYMIIFTSWAAIMFITGGPGWYR